MTCMVLARIQMHEPFEDERRSVRRPGASYVVLAYGFSEMM